MLSRRKSIFPIFSNTCLNPLKVLCYTFGCIQLEHNYCYCLSQNRNCLFHSSHYFIMMCRKNIIPLYLLTFNQTVIKKNTEQNASSWKNELSFSWLYFVSVFCKQFCDNTAVAGRKGISSVYDKSESLTYCFFNELHQSRTRFDYQK